MPSSHSNVAIEVLGGISAEHFLSEYWQKKPLLIRQAIPHYQSPISQDELAGLSLEEDVESRLIAETLNGQSWVLQNGPFQASDFSKLPASHWTLLVQQLDAWHPEINELKHLFNFIPNWRVDDIMASYAPVGGSVGPHFDYYDVFLLQTSGAREWKLGQTCDAQSATRPDTPLSILSEFSESDCWTLEPGDMLYVPPKLAHFGKSLSDDCITFSIGFRAPSNKQLLSSFADYVIEHAAPEIYGDPDLSVQAASGEITSIAKASLRKHMLAQIEDPKLFEEWLGGFLTEPKNQNVLHEAETLLKPEELDSTCGESDYLYKNEGSRFAYTFSSAPPDNTGVKELLLSVDGQTFKLGHENLTFVQNLCEEREIDTQEILVKYTTIEVRQCICDLLNQGSLITDRQLD